MKKKVYLLLFAASLLLGACNVGGLSKSAAITVVTKCCTKMVVGSRCTKSSLNTTAESASSASQDIIPALLWDSKMMF